ncbi:serine/threonine-protein kinase [Noviherbaspirillum saxi]|uniref:Serine/threonine protein kinase n=1 Tax=Noviherbaspirillum saxi TaxID=2320863 RepID=A0A3A3FMI3_9BURK|nr:serine/threonine-protein kinase [Noviherbaspirillum saxi]RJF95695.1 serine/threonine protein kinase [Noviherbaspirillum saxi]
MSELIKFLSTGSIIAIVISAAIVILTVIVTVIYVVAFAQGRSISFWPPSIGERPKALVNPLNGGEDMVSSDASTTEAFPSPVVGRGTILDGAAGKKYRVSSAFFGGTRATLYKAEDPGGHTVLAKVYWRGLTPNSPPWELFQQEQRSAEILTHRNIVQTLDRGLRIGYPFTILEYLQGGSLQDWLRTHNRLPGRDILSIASQIAEALDYAHSRGVIHLDVKPGNVLFESNPEGRVALSDFGIAKILGAVERVITVIPREFAGTPGYLAPELIVGMPPTPQADIYSFGIVLFEMISKVIPFDDTREILAVLEAKVNKDAPDIRSFRPDVPNEIAERLAQVLARDLSLRPATAHAVISGIEERIREL